MNIVEPTRPHLLYTLLAVAYLCQNMAAAQETKTTLPDLPNSKLIEYAEFLRPTLVLKLDENDNLRLDREAWKSSALSPAQQKQAMLKGFGNAKDESIVRYIANQIPKQRDELTDTIVRFIYEIGRSNILTQKHDRTDWSADGCRIRVTNSQSGHSISIVDSRARLVIDENSPIAGFAAHFSCPGVRWTIRNFDAEVLRVDIAIEGKRKSLSGKNWNDLLKKNPDDGMLLCELMTQVGFLLPLTQDNEQVSREAIVTLQSRFFGTKIAFDLLFDQLNSPVFEFREEAKRKLLDQYDDLKGFIDQAIFEEQGEAAQRIVLVQIKKQQDPSDPNSRYSDFILSNQLLSDTDFLVRLFDFTSEDARSKRLVARHLKKITGKDFGEDVEAWKAFANKE